jgi:hypothetical protein
LGVAWCGDGANFFEVHMRGSAVERQVRSTALDEPGLRIEIGNHGDVFLSGMKKAGQAQAHPALG